MKLLSRTLFLPPNLSCVRCKTIVGNETIHGMFVQCTALHTNTQTQTALFFFVPSVFHEQFDMFSFMHWQLHSEWVKFLDQRWTLAGGPSPLLLHPLWSARYYVCLLFGQHSICGTPLQSRYAFPTPRLNVLFGAIFPASKPAPFFYTFSTSTTRGMLFVSVWVSGRRVDSLFISKLQPRV